WSANVKIVIRQFQPVAARSRQQLAVAVDGGVEARHVELLRLRSERLIRECIEWSGPGYDAKERGQQSRPEARPLVRRTPVLFVAGAREVVEELLARNAGNFPPDLLLFDLPRHFGQGRKDGSHGAAVRSDRQIHTQEHGLELH